MLELGKTLMRPACASFVALVLLGLGPTPTVAIAQEPSSAVSTPQGASRQVQQEAFSRQIAERMERVPEFKYIREEAARMGAKAYLFGGTAAGYAHYVKWDMQREAGDSRFQPDRFDYDYTNIYRSTQDLDIVIDGPPEKAAELQAKLMTAYPHLQGSKTAWEVRLLRQDMGDKQALLNNPDFMNQHTDSNSTGMIEITKPSAGDAVVRDLRDWNSKSPYFLQDVLNGKIHYYFSPSHGSTAFAKQGRNPPIISVIRYLTKAFQYELEIRPDDLARIKKIIDDFKPNGSEMKNSYVKHWLLNKDNGRKLIQNAVNIEYAWDTLEKLDLRKKLIAIENNPDTVGSLAWWMNKEPLRTYKVGANLRNGRTIKGRTARELGLDIVAHETNNFLAYESITRAHTGDANVLISRNNTAGEAAVHGDGFYTRIGREGARGTGLTIRFHLSPEAREGIDFAKTGDFVIVHNKAALRVIPESLNIDPVHFFEMLSEGKDFSHSDLGLLEKLKRRNSQMAARLSPADREKLTSIARQEFAKPHPNPLIVDMWMNFPFVLDHPDLISKLIDQNKLNMAWVAEQMLSRPEWRSDTELAVKLIESKSINPDWVIQALLPLPDWKERNEVIEKLFDNGIAAESIFNYLLSQPEWSNRPDFIKKLLDKHAAASTIADILIQPEWGNHPELVEKLFEYKNINPEWLAQVLLQQPHWKQHPELIEKLIDQGTADAHVAQYILSQPEWSNRHDLIKTLLKRGTADVAIANLLSQPQWENHPELVEMLFESNKIDPQWYAQALLQQPHWKKHPQLVEKLIDQGTADKYVAQYILSQPEWSNRSDLIKAILKRGTADVEVATLLLQPQWENHPELIEKLIESKNINPNWIAEILLQQPHWKKHPQLVEKLIDKGTADASVAQYILSQPEWSNRQDLIKKLIERGHGNYLKTALKPDAPDTTVNSSTTATTDADTNNTSTTIESDTKPAEKSGNCLVRFVKNLLR
jgi:hypothetical protein